MKTTLVCLAALTFTLGAGCQRSATDSPGQAESKLVESGVTYKEGKGLHIPASTAKFIGLRVEDVAERKVTGTVRFDAEVYRTAVQVRSTAPHPQVSMTALASALVNEADAGKIRQGQEVAVKTTGRQELRGRIVEVKPSLDTNGSQIEMIVAISDEQAQLTNGTLVSIALKVGEEKVVVAVPTSAVLRTSEGTFVYASSGEKFVRTPVKLGVANPEFVEISDGLYAGDQIVLQPVMTLWMAELQFIRGGKACADGH